MDAWQTRVIEEASELESKIISLKNFQYEEAYAKLPQVDKTLLGAQLTFMLGYLEILRQRIALFNKGNK